MKALIKKINKTNSNLTDLLERLRKELQPLVDFEIYVTILTGDGLAVMSEEESTGMSINDVLMLIETDGYVNYDNWNPYL